MIKIEDLLNDKKDLPVTGVTSDSRRVKAGFLFAALPGNKVKGSEYIVDAVHHGAHIIIAEHGVFLPDSVDTKNVILINVDNTRQAFSKLAAKFYKIQPTNIVAVTGTSGKTSTVSFVQQLWHLSGEKECASLGTLGLRGPGLRRYGSLTTTDTQALHADLADLASSGIHDLAMEASSHGLDQYREDGVNIEAAAFTNLSRDHLDYHQDMESYFKVKSRLFSEVMPAGRCAVLNADDDMYPSLVEICKAESHDVISFGYKGDNLKIISRQPQPGGQNIHLQANGIDYKFRLPLVGEFQVMNALCAVGLVMADGYDVEDLIPLLEKLRGVSGRLQLVDGHPNGAVYVDYAHKPAALEAVLNTLRPHTKNNLVCVFGCGGNRDPGKREMMGSIARQLADKVIITDDNPRYEDADQIRAQILKAIPDAQEIADRQLAIQTAVNNLEEGDVLVVAGKGHEQGQIVGEEAHPFDDAAEIKKAIEGLSL